MNRQEEVVFPQRFLFYFSSDATSRVLNEQRVDCISSYTPEVVKQNWTGGTLAISGDAFFRIGGFDEEFIGWTGEDRQFYDRCQTLHGWFFGYVPFLHLWHPPQIGRVSVEHRAAAWEFTQNKLNTDRQLQIAQNRLRNFAEYTL